MRLLPVLILAPAISGSWAARASDVVPGQTAPDLELRTLDGKAAKLSDLRGRVVLAKFGATW